MSQINQPRFHVPVLQSGACEALDPLFTVTYRCKIDIAQAPIALERKHICTKSHSVIKMRQQRSTSLKGSTRDALHTFSCYSKFYFYRTPSPHRPIPQKNRTGTPLPVTTPDRHVQS